MIRYCVHPYILPLLFYNHLIIAYSFSCSNINLQYPIQLVYPHLFCILQHFWFTLGAYSDFNFPISFALAILLSKFSIAIHGSQILVFQFITTIYLQTLYNFFSYNSVLFYNIANGRWVINLQILQFVLQCLWTQLASFLGKIT